jgi:hypothetical protein
VTSQSREKDSAAAYSAMTVKRFLANRSMVDLSYPLCSPDLAPADFRLFYKIKTAPERWEIVGAPGCQK